MVSRRAIVVGVGTVLLAWLLISSIHLVQPTASQGGSASNQENGGGSSGGSGSGNFQGLGGGGFSLFRLPPLNFSFNFPDWFHFPNFNFPFPTLANQSSPGFGSGLGGGGSGGGGGTGGNSGQGGSSGNGNSNSEISKPNDPPQFVIPTELLIIVAVIALILAGTGFVVAQRKNFTRKPKRKSTGEELVPIASLQVSPIEKTSFFDPRSELTGEEKVANFAGWEGSGFIKPGIRNDLPLIWSLDEPLVVSTPVGAKLSFSGSELPSKDPIEYSSQVFDLSLAAPCNKISGEYNQVKEEKWIRAVHYNEDVTKLFRLNLINSSGFDLKSMTARELARYIVAQKPEIVKDKGHLFGLTRIFERAFYGKKEINRKEYESFLERLSGALISPKVIICGPRDQESKSER